ncbi:MAG: SH3 domain-containing protein [Oscillospiraceae bacterium]|jgi:hypothetical protein|nr:SH3 domain-containing protein [Oscillospiraceae bacterium]
MRNKNSAARALALALAIIAALAAAAPALAASSQQSGYVMFGAVATVTQSAPLYQDSAFSVALEPVKSGAQAIVIDWIDNNAKVYMPQQKQAGWLSRSNLRLTGERVNLAVVCSQNASIRQSASVTSSQVTTAANGQVLDVQSVSGEWFNVRYVNPSTKREYYGWVRSDFVAYQPDWIVAHTLVDVYAMPRSGSNRVAQVAKGVSLMILGEMNGYLCVNLRNASGFVNMRDVRRD